MTDTVQPKPGSIVGVFIKFSLLCGCLLGVVWMLVGRSALEKIVTGLAMPCGVIWYMLSFSVFLAYRARQGKLTVCIGVTWLLYTMAGNGFLCTIFMNQIEADFQSIDPLQQEPFDVVVLLGGGASVGANVRQQGNSSGDRLILAAQLYHSGLAKKLICTGRRIKELSNVEFDPAEQSSLVLQGLGVPADVIELAGGRTTSEEMLGLGKRFQGADVRVGLVTSAWHLRRAMRLAKRNGFEPHPLPADFMTGPSEPWTLAEKLMAIVPNADCVVINSRIAKEYLGALIGR